MEQSIIIKTFETSLITNFWVERYNFMVVLMVCAVSIYIQFSLIMFFELLLGSFVFTGIACMGFVAFAAHIRYYFRFERNRKVELYTDRMIMNINGDVWEEILKKDIVKITLFDKLKNKSGSDSYNLWPSFADPFYYLVVIGKNRERIILTCLLDMKLKKKIAAWYGQELEHKYQFFPFPSS